MRWLCMIPAVLMLISLSVQAEPVTWQGTLEDGSQVVIDSDTNKVTRSSDGVTSPLWDGVHTLSNGAVIIVRDGIVVKDAAILDAERDRQQEQLSAACMQLAAKVCGEHNECDSQPACDPARQLMAMERKEMQQRPMGNLETSSLCLEGLQNEDFFRACPKRSGAEKTACERLVLKVCGADEQCTEREACDAARQLVKMEQQDRLRVPGGFTYATAQCRDQLGSGSDYFRACE
ncbi:MAG: hypothetical protein ABW068_14155 [Candidatus Thiodiazotropha sp.]